MGDFVPPDPTVIDLMGHLAWRPPGIVREAALLTRSAKAFRASQMAQIEELERQMRAWIEAGMAKREHLWKMVAGSRASPRSLENLTALIESFERQRLADAADLERQDMALRHDREQAQLSKDAADTLEETDERWMQAQRTELQTRLDFALFLRAVRAELDPSSRGGVTFENADELEDYLSAAVSS